MESIEVVPASLLPSSGAVAEPRRGAGAGVGAPSAAHRQQSSSRCRAKDMVGCRLPEAPHEGRHGDGRGPRVACTAQEYPSRSKLPMGNINARNGRHRGTERRTWQDRTTLPTLKAVCLVKTLTKPQCRSTVLQAPPSPPRVPGSWAPEGGSHPCAVILVVAELRDRAAARKGTIADFEHCS